MQWRGFKLWMSPEMGNQGKNKIILRYPTLENKMLFLILIFQEGIGACLINNPEFVADVVKQTR